MTGFKSGASSDPYSNDTESSSNTDDSTMASLTDTDTDTDRQTDPEPAQQQDDTTENESTLSMTSLPWIYQRDSITDGRAKTVQLHLQDSTLGLQRQTRSDVEEELGESVKKADLREAAFLVGLNQVDDVAGVLREWGYDFD